MVLSRLTKITGPGISTDTNLVANNADFSGITTSATSFNIGVTTIHSNLIEAHNIKSTGIITATGAHFSGNVSIAGTFTYEDVTNVDSIGIITARSQLNVGNNIKLGNAGVITATSFVGNGDFVELDVDGHTNLDNVNIAGVSTFSGNVLINGDLEVSSSLAYIRLTDSNSSNDDFGLRNDNGVFFIRDVTNGGNRFSINSEGTLRAWNRMDFDAGIHLNAGDLRIVDTIKHRDDEDTKIRFPANDTISMETAGSERLRVDASGNVMIGTTDNTGYNNTSEEGIVIRGGDCIDIVRTGDGQLYLNRLGSDGQHIYFYRDGVMKTSISTRNNSFCIDINNSEKLRVDTNGNVLIGTTDNTIYDNSSGEGVVIRGGDCIDIARNNDNQLFLNRQGGDGPQIAFLRDGSYKSFIGTRSNAFYIDVDGSERLRISSGQVMIGTTSSVAGNLVVKSFDSSSNQVWIIGRSSDNTASVSFRNNADNAYTGRIEVEDTNGMTFQVGGSDRLKINSSGNMGLGVTPNANWPDGDFRAFQLGTGACVFGRGSGDEDRGGLAVNYYYASGDKYLANGHGSRIYMADGNIYLQNAASNSSGAGAAMSLKTRLLVNQTGRLKINHTQTPGQLDDTWLSIYDANSDSSANDPAGISKNYAMINLHNYGTGSPGDVTGIAFGAASSFAYTKGSIAFERTGSYGTGDLVFLTNNDQDTTLVNDTDEKMRISREGYVTKPETPSWVLRPSYASNQTLGSGTHAVGWSSSDYNTHAKAVRLKNVTLSGSGFSNNLHNGQTYGKIVVPVAGIYRVWCTIRMENNPVAGNLFLYVDGSQVVRQHVEMWNHQPYMHGRIEHIVNLNANSYIIWALNCNGGVVSGIQDTVNWCGGHLIG